MKKYFLLASLFLIGCSATPKKLDVIEIASTPASIEIFVISDHRSGFSTEFIGGAQASYSEAFAYAQNHCKKNNRNAVKVSDATCISKHPNFWSSSAIGSCVVFECKQ